MSDQTLTTEVPAGTGEENQATPTQGEQTGGQPQPEPQTGTPSKVDGQAQNPTGSTGARGLKPSEYIQNRIREKRQLTELRNQVAEMKQMIQSMQQPKTAPVVETKQKKDYSKMVWDNPASVIDEIAEEKVNHLLETKLDQLLELRLSKQQYETKKQEGLELIFTNENVKADGDEGIARIQEILKTRGLDFVADKDPVMAAKTALEIYTATYGKPAAKPADPLVPKKGQMGTTQTGASPKPKEESMDEVLSQVKQMKEQLMKDPSLSADPAFRQRYDEVKKKVAEASSQK